MIRFSRSLFVACLLLLLSAKGSVQARSFRSWFGFQKKTPSEKKTTESLQEEGTSKPTNSLEKPFHQTATPLSSPAFMTVPKNVTASDSWRNYAEHSCMTSLVLQGLIYINDNQWTVWLNGRVLMPSLRSLSIGERTMQIVSVTPRSVTFKSAEENITLYVGQSYNLQTHQLSVR